MQWTQPISGIYQYGIFKINVNVNYRKKWNWHSYFHYLISFILVLSFYLLKFKYPVLYSFLLGLGWEILDSIKPLYTKWRLMQPEWISPKIWGWFGEVLNSDGFGILDVVRENSFGLIQGFIFIKLGLVNHFLI